MVIHIPEFDEAQHAYVIDGKPAPGVTSIISACLGVNPFWTKEGRESGRATHLAIHFYAQDDLDYDSLDEATKPRLDAYIKFCEDHQWKPDLIEQPLYHPTLRYCGTPDQGQLDRAVVDFKNGPHLPQHALQLAAYANMLPNPLQYERWGVQLLDIGKYKLEPYKKQTMTADFNTFNSMLNVWNWRKKWMRG